MSFLYIVWNNEYDFRIPIIDDQHRTLVSIINPYTMLRKYIEMKNAQFYLCILDYLILLIVNKL